MTDPLTRRYIVIEFVDAWSGYVIEATSKAEAIAKVKAGDKGVEDSWSGNGGPNGRYRAERADWTRGGHR